MKTSISTACYGLVLCAACHAGNAIAADSPVSQASNPPVTLNAVTVTASLNQTSVEEMPLHTTIITRDDIEKSPAQTLDQLLRTVPGFNFTGIPAAISDPTGQQTKMRGLGNAKVLVLLDGIPIMDPFYLTTQFYKVPLADIDHIEIIRGGTSSLWGSMAGAGVVNIITKRPTDNSGVLTVGGGSEGTTNVAWSQNFTVSDALALNLAIDQYRTHGYIQTPSPYLWKFPGLKANSARDTNVELSAFFHLTDDLSGFVRVGDHVYRGEQMNEIRTRLVRTLRAEGRITAARFRDVVGTSRKYIVPLLEYFDATGVTVRDGDQRALRASRSSSSA